MMRAWMLATLVTAGLLGIGPIAAADDWEDRLRDQRSQQKKELRNYYDVTEDDLERMEDEAEDRLRAERSHALRHAPPGHRADVLRYFREKWKAIDQIYDEQEAGLKDWYKQQKDWLDREYDVAREIGRYGHAVQSPYPMPGHVPYGFVQPGYPIENHRHGYRSEGPILRPANPMVPVQPAPIPAHPMPTPAIPPGAIPIGPRAF
jgi:hypothetical protein